MPPTKSFDLTLCSKTCELRCAMLFVLALDANVPKLYVMRFLHSLQYQCPPVRFQPINYDIAKPFPSSKGFAYILICIDPFTRWIKAFPMLDQTTCSVIQSLNFHMQYFGVRNEIHTESGCQFTSSTFKQYFIFMGTNHRVSSVRYPTSDGLAERPI